MQQENKLKDSLLTFLQNLFDLAVINWLWLLCSLPVITIGPATCGLYRVTLKLARNELLNPAKEFFRGFRENLKPGLILGLLALLLGIVSAGDAYFALTQTGMNRSLFLVVAIIVASILLTLMAYGFALQAMFDNPLKLQLLNTLKLALVAPGKTIQLWVILLIPVIVFLVLPPVVLRMIGFLYFVLGVSAPAFACSHILRNLFDRIEQAAARQDQ